MATDLIKALIQAAKAFVRDDGDEFPVSARSGNSVLLVSVPYDAVLALRDALPYAEAEVLGNEP